MNTIGNLLRETGFAMLLQSGGWQNILMLCIAVFLLYLAICRKCQPLFLCAAAFGMLLANLPGAELFHEILFAGGSVQWNLLRGAPVTQELLSSLAAAGVPQRVLASVHPGQVLSPGLVDFLYLGQALGVYPCLLLMGLGTRADFDALIKAPRCFLIGALSQLGVFAAAALLALAGFSGADAASAALAGGLCGPAALFAASRLAPSLIAPIALSICLCMAAAPHLTPRFPGSVCKQSAFPAQRTAVSGKEQLLFAVLITILVSLLLPAAGALIGSLMFGALLRACGVTGRLEAAIRQDLFSIVLIFLGLCLGLSSNGQSVLTLKTPLTLLGSFLGLCIGRLLRSALLRLFRLSAEVKAGLCPEDLICSILTAGFFLSVFS